MGLSLKSLLRAQVEGKAFGPTPSFEDPGRPVEFIDLQIGRSAGQSPSRSIGGKRMTQRYAARHIGAYGGEGSIDWVVDCLRYWADTVSNAEYHFEGTKPSDPEEKNPSKAIVPPANLTKLLEQPNPYQDYIEMMELLVIDLMLVGNAYWFKWRTNERGQPLALYRLAPPYVEVATTPWGPGAYVYQIPNADKIIVQPEEMIHFRLANPDPANPYYGLGLIQGAGRAADLETALTHTQSSYFENHAMPSISVESDRRVPRDVFKKMRAQLRARAQGPKNAGELLVLEAGLKLNAIAPNAAEAAYQDLSRMSRNRVFSWFKMHPALVGMLDESRPPGFVAEMQEQFDNKAARPFMNKLQTKITNDLIKEAWDLRYVIDYEYQLTPGQRAKLGQMVGQQPGITIDESRKAGGYGPHPDKKIGEVTLNLPGEEAGTGQPGDPTRKGFPDKPLAGEAGRPPKPSNTKAIPAGSKALPKGSKARKPAGKAMTVEAVSARLDQMIQAPVERLPPDLLADRRVYDVDAVTSSFEDSLGRAARVLERGLLDTVEGKAFDDADILSKLRESTAWESFDELAKQAYEQALLKVMSAAAIHHGEIGFKPAGDIDYHALIDDLVNRKDSGIAAISKSFKKTVAAAVEASKSEATSMADVQEAVQEAVAKWVRDKGSMIAITEATRGYNAATLDVADKAGLKEVYVSDGLEDDAPCIEANGSTWTLEYARAHELEHPRCRRAFVPLAS